MAYKFKKIERPSDEVVDIIRKSGSANPAERLEALGRLANELNEGMQESIMQATALETPLRAGNLVGDVATYLFEMRAMEPGASLEFPLDLLAPGEEDEFVAYTNPGNGRIPERQVEGDYVQVPTFGQANSIDWLLRYARDARWDIVGRATQVFEAGFVKKINDDCWHTLLAAGVDRNILVFDADANPGQLTKRVISLAKILVRRGGGGNTGSIKRKKLTDIFISPEGVEDMRNWGVDQVDEMTRREIYVAEDGALNRVFGVNLHDMDEFGESQEYQTYFGTQLGGSMATSDVEIAVGVDLSANDSFLMPIREKLEVFTDPVLHRSQKAGIYGWMDYGVVVFDNRNVIIISF